MSTDTTTDQSLRAENAELRSRLEEAEDMQRAIRAGELDALVVEGDAGPQLFTLQGLDAEQYRLRGEMLAQVSDAVMAVDLDERVTFINAAAERQYGVRASVVLGRKLSEVFTRHWPSPEREAAAWAAVREHGDWHGEYVQRTHDGRELHVDSTHTALRDAEGETIGHVTAVRDITERKRSEEAVARLAAIVESSHDALFGENLGGIITSWNPGAEQIFGYRADEIVGTSIMRLIPEALQDKELELQRKLAAGERGGTFEAIRQGKDGRKFHASITISPMKDAAGKVIGTSRVVRDITEHKRSEEALARLAAIVESSQDAIVSKDLPGTITSWNHGAETMFGYSAKEIVGQPDLCLIPPERHDEEADILARVGRGEGVRHFETVRLRKDGSTVEVSITVSPVKDASGTIIGISKMERDITARRLIEAALRQNATLFAKIIEQAPGGVYVMDAQLRVREVNSEALPVFASAQPVIGRELGEVLEILWGPELGRECTAIVQRTLETGERYISPRFDHLRRDIGVEQAHEWETQRLTLPDGQHGVVCYFKDVTERVRAAETLRASEERIRLATEATGVGIWEWNLITHGVRWDAEMFRIYGIEPTPDGFVHYSDWSGAVLPEDLAENEAILQDAVLRCGQSARSFRIRRRNDGECRYVEAVETVRVNAEGKAEWVFGTNLDVTEDKRAAQTLNEAKEAAEAANRSKDRFLAVLSHELRTPLTPVLMTVTALEHDPDLRPDVREDMTMIRRNVEMETKLIDDLLDVSRIASGKLELHPEPLDLNGAVQHVCAICRPQVLEQEVQLTLDLCTDAGFIHADPARFEQVLWNVLKNAVKFTPRKGTIHIASQRLSPTRVEVRLTDSGVGIPPEVLPKIFDAFEQGDPRVTRQFGGLGLGLAISKALIELHSGNIRAESPGTGKGSTFIIEVPGTPLPATAPSQPAAPEPARPTALRLLIAEDHGDTSRALKTLLTLEGFAVTTASDVASALKLAQTETFDILISDLGLPDASGYDLMARLQDIQPLRGIAMSGHSMEKDIRQSLAAGFSEHLVKPIKIPQLLAAVERLTSACGETLLA